MLEPDERRQINRLLLDRFDVAGLERLLADVNVQYEDVVSQRGNRLNAIKEILDAVEFGGWAPALLDAMISEFESAQPGPLLQDAAQVRQIQKNIAARLGRGTALLQPFRSCFVRNNWPFVNRPDISDAFIMLSRAGGSRIVVLNGPSGSGKTYSKELAQYVSEIRPDLKIKVIYKDVSEGNYNENGNAPGKLVRSILTEWRKGSAPVPAQQLGSDNTYAQELSEFLATNAPEEPRDVTWWIVIDGIAKITAVGAPLLKFLEELEKYIADSTLPLRLVLLDLGEQNALPGTAENVAVKIKIDTLTTADLVEHYFKALHEANPQIAFDTTLASKKAQWVIDQVNGQPPVGGPAQLKQHLLTATKELGFA